eukprot:scaffold37195_cov67-Phaeocystis_antarctica.AAC.1
MSTLPSALARCHAIASMCTHERMACNPMHPDCNSMHPTCHVLCFSGAARCDCATRRLPSGKRRRLRQRGAGARVGPQGKAIGYRPRLLDGRPTPFMYRKALTRPPASHPLTRCGLPPIFPLRCEAASTVCWPSA